MKNDCVPLAIHNATGLPYDLVLSEAARRGWNEQTGMHGIAGWRLMRDLGVMVSQIMVPDERLTLARFLPQLEVHKKYIISVKEHWFAFHAGMTLDPVKTHPRTEVRGYMWVECQKYCWCRDFKEGERGVETN